MKDSISVTIPKPCHEKWESFNPTTLGGFCSSCQKEVIDFSTWDEDQIKNYFQYQPKSVCGRFKTSQLKNYTLEKKQSASTPKRMPIAAALGLTMLLSSKQAHAQEVKEPNLEHVALTGKVDVAHAVADTLAISGIVYDENDAPMPGVSVYMNGKDIARSTGVDGKFQFLVNEVNLNDTLIFQFVGYRVEHHVVTNFNPIVKNLQPDDATLEVITCTIAGEVMVVNKYSPRAIWRRFKAIFR